MDKTIEITILGCGGSGGTPLATGYWGRCDMHEPRNRRTRASIMVRTQRTCVVIDSGPDFRAQTLRENIDKIDAVIYTHPHGDHVNGIDDLRYVAIKQRRIQDDEAIRVPIYADDYTLNDLQSRFHYMFNHSPDGVYIPLIESNLIDDYADITVDDLTLKSFVQIHGKGRSLGYRIGDVGYSTDTSDLNDKALNALVGINTWIVDCGQYDTPTEDLTVHTNLECVLKWNETVGANKIYLTHLTPRADYQTINAETPGHVECAYDGLKITANIK
jgi:phosphoribosyl 1,2-cyclic phosphate phosphodiesterase